MRIALAIGGNALIRAGEAGTWEQQQTNAREIAVEVAALHAAGHQLRLTPGNGPLVGALMLQQALGGAEAPPLPLDALTAMTQGQIGYLLMTALGQVDPSLPTAALITRERVDVGDPAFDTPTKRVGPFYGHEDAGRLAEQRKWDMAPDAGRGWRRVVASPRPREV
ncbi:MAG: carbamate kinase, partial [Thermoleophilia bacterium]|nr:carbamate kinase [Thermoleophilia bacterium]